VGLEISLGGSGERLRSSEDWKKWAPFSGLWMIPLVDDQSKQWAWTPWRLQGFERTMDRLKKRAPVIDAIFEVIFRTEETYRFGAKRNLLL
jgi:hypothetical protein